MTKNIVVLCDGTWNSEIETDENYSTNVALLARALINEPGIDAFVGEDETYLIYPKHNAQDSTSQIIFYSHGVGVCDGADHYWGGMFGKGINKNIMDAYRFLVEHYQPGDQIFVLGFSRGAYTVRSLIGLIRNVGLADSKKIPHDKKAKNKFFKACFLMYQSRRDDAHVNSVQAAMHRGKFAHSMRYVQDVIVDINGNEFVREGDDKAMGIHYVGVWDTVGALGVPHALSSAVNFLTWGDYNEEHFGFHDTCLSKIVRVARHAVAIDEYRKAFVACLWSAHETLTQSEQRWFPGAHGDVGGGYKADEENGVLSDLAGFWVVEQAINAGLQLKNPFIGRIVLSAMPRRPPGVKPTVTTAIVHDPLQTSIWRLSEKTHREIGIASTDERISDEAIKRFQKRVDYRPDNLKTAIRALNLSGYFS